VDLVVLGIIGVSVLFGLYKGFISGVLGLAALLLALLAAYVFYPQLAKALQSNQSLVDTLIHYSDASSRIHDLDLAMTPVASIPQQVLDEVLRRANLPDPFGAFVRTNILGQAFATLGSVNVAEYLNQTIIAVSINILCFLAAFAGGYIAALLVLNLVNYVFQFPAIKHFDALLGGVFGLIRGVFVVFVLFALVPILLTVSPIEQVSQLITESHLAAVFYRSSVIQTIMQGTIL
jgi:uncharacterized membrane protein required for colicin V production